MKLDPIYSGRPMPYTSSQLGEFDFGTFFDKVATTATGIYTAKTAADVQKAQLKLAQQQAAQNQAYNDSLNFSLPNSPVYSGSGLNLGGSNMLPILAIGGLALVAFMLLKKR